MAKKKWVLVLVLAGLAVAVPSLVGARSADPQVDPATAEVPAPGDDQSYVACYFGSADDPIWRWALTSGDDQYVIDGEWQTTQFTQVEKFFTTATNDEMNDACINAQSHGGIDRSLFAWFAATGSADSRHPIVIGGTTELFPQY